MFRISFSLSSTNELLTKAVQNCASNNFEEWEKKIWSFIALWLDEKTAEITVTTSGSTGLPKIITHSKSAMRQSAINTISALSLTKKDVAFLCLPADKIGGMMMIVRAIVLELDLICIKPSANPWLEISEQIEVTFLACTPMQLAASFNTKNSFQSANQISTILLGGGPITPTMFRHLLLMKNNVYHTFGMTETISHIALKKVSGVKPDTNFTTIGDTTIRQDKRQCLVIDSPTLEIKNLVTNDVVKIISNHSFEWLGRFDNVINTGGLKIHPEQLEEILIKKINVPFFIFGKVDELTGERICLAVTVGFDQTKIREAITTLPKNSQPKELHFLEAMIYTATGKLDRIKSLTKTISTSLF